MKSPTIEIISAALWVPLDYLDVQADMTQTDVGPRGYRRALSAVLKSRCGVPPVTYLIHDSIPYRRAGGESGWFLVDALAGPHGPVSGTEHGEQNFTAFGHLETKKFFGLKTVRTPCIANVTDGTFRTCTEDFLKIVLAIATEERVPEVTKSVSEVMEALVAATPTNLA